MWLWRGQFRKQPSPAWVISLSTSMMTLQTLTTPRWTIWPRSSKSLNLIQVQHGRPKCRTLVRLRMRIQSLSYRLYSCLQSTVRLSIGSRFRFWFTALIIENKDLHVFACMHYLVSSLRDRAFDSLSGLTITADNFAVAWQSLMDRYDNK